MARESDSQIEQLRGDLHGRWRQATRAVMVLLSAHGLAAAQIAELLDCHPATVRRWISVFRPAHGPLAGGLMYIIGRYTPVPAQIAAAYVIAWLLLLSGVRGILVRGTQSGDGQKLSQLTLIPRVIWYLLWLAATLAAVAVGGSWLVMRS